MKPRLLYLLLVPACWLLACKKEKDTPPDKSANLVTATIQVASATPFTFRVTGEAADIKPVYPGSSAYHIYARDPANRTLFIYLPGVKAGGTYPLTANSAFSNTEGALEYNSNFNGNGLDNIYYTTTPAATAKGSVTVTLFTARRMEGTFTARAKNLSGEEVVITNGRFAGAL